MFGHCALTAQARHLYLSLDLNLYLHLYLCRRQLIEPPYTGGISTTDIIQKVGDRALANAAISEAGNEAPASS